MDCGSSLNFRMLVLYHFLLLENEPIFGRIRRWRHEHPMIRLAVALAVAWPWLIILQAARKTGSELFHPTKLHVGDIKYN